MAEKKFNGPPRGPGGPGARGGFQKPKSLLPTLGKLLRYMGRYKGLLLLVVVLLA